MPRFANSGFRRNHKKGQATVYYTRAEDDSGQKQLCVVGECHLSGARTPPIWGHKSNSVKRCMATLTQLCECPSSYHRPAAYEGHCLAHD